MLIAVTGATGFLGRYVVNHLLEQGHAVRAWCRRGSDRGGFVDGPIEWVKGALDKPKSATALVRGVDAVVHGALHRIGASFKGDGDELVDFVQTNVVGSVRLMSAARAAGVGRFIFISSCAVHDKILADRTLDEAHALWPKSHYGAHKAALEMFVHSFGLGEGWPICSLRPTGIYGLARPEHKSRFIEIVRQVLAGETIASEAGGKEVHAADAARAVGILLNAPADAIAGQAFNCYDLYVAVQDVAEIAKAASGSSSVIERLNHGPKHQIDTSKIRALGMTFGGRELLERTVGELVEIVRRER